MSKKDESISRKQRAFIALHDLGSREGATAASVRAGMLKEGFTLAEIRTAVEEYASTPHTPTGE